MNSIEIAKPCHENWDKMTPVEQGRHCQKCVKTVHDVSNWSDEKIESTYHQEDGNMCIRIPVDRVKPTRSKSWKYYLTAALATFLMVIKKNVVKALNDVSDSTTGKQLHDTTQKLEKIRITGTVNDTINQEGPLPYANVYVKRDSIVIGGAITNHDGQFVIELQGDFELSDTLKLTVEYVGYTPVTRTFAVRDKMDIEVLMAEGHICLNEKITMIDRTYMLLGGPAITTSTTMGLMVNTKTFKRAVRRTGVYNSILQEGDTKTLNQNDLERLNLGR